MRYAALILGILGGLTTGGLGSLWAFHHFRDKDSVELSRKLVGKGLGGQQANDELAEFDRRAKTFPFLLAGLPLGIAGGFLALAGRRWSAAVLLLLAAIGPGILHPITLVFASPIIIGGILSLFVKPKPTAQLQVA